jgi:hypothetical protein
MRLPACVVVLFMGFCAASLGCGAGLKLTLIDASVKRPSNIAVYFTVDSSDGEPVAGLTADSFRILEDEQMVSALESKQTILNPEVAATHYTLLLVDMSGSVTGSGDVPVIVDAVRGFSERVEKYQKVAVYAFDGSPTIHPIVGFSSGGALAGGVARLGSFRPRDPSTNLNGAVMEAHKVLEHQIAAAPTSLAFGTLVVFTDGTDRAGRVTRDQLHQHLQESRLDLVVIGVGAEINEHELRVIGGRGTILSKDRAKIAQSFEAAAARVEAFSKRYYLLGYCSPARAGTHEVRIEAHAGGRSGSLSYRFDAAGFRANCDPTQKPSFNLKRPRRPSAEADQPTS